MCSTAATGSSFPSPFGRSFLARIRPLEPDDIAQIVALRRQAFAHSAVASDSALASYYRTLFFENPWYESRFPSLVYAEQGGEVRGFIGAIPRPMLLGSERLTAVVSTELMVAPESRGLVGPTLVRRLFEGGQDLTFSDRSNNQAKVLYESLGGTTAPWYSLYWAIALDGSRMSFGGAANTAPGLTSRIIRGAANSLNRLSTRFTRYSALPLPTRHEPLIPETVVSNIRRVGGQNALTPEYRTESFAWLLKRLTDRPGRMASAQVTHDGAIVGWFVYAFRSSREAEVVQLAAFPRREEMVFDHLVQHAVGEGANILRGRLDRRFATVLSDRGVPLTLGHPWTVVHSRRKDVANEFVNGNAFFSRLEAEWWISS
jgi:hypothetical protein